MASVALSIRTVFRQYPIVRGVVSYAIIWPTSSICQQTIAGRNWETYDYAKAIRFSLYGACFVAPTLYGWIRFSSFLWPQSNLRTAVKKALIEQVSYGPVAIFCFLFGMSILESKTIAEATEEVKHKFLPTYKLGVFVWPVLQTVNFCFISEKNRVPYLSICSFIWTCILAYIKQQDIEKHHEILEQPQQQ